MLPASVAVIWPLTLAVVANVVFSLIFLFIVVTLRRPPNRSATGTAHDGRQVTVVSYAN